MRLLLTRAAADAERTGARLAEAGHDVLLAPVIEIVSLGASWPGGVVDAVLATSGQALAMLDPGPSPEARRLMPLFLVGDRTAAIAREQGFLGPVTTAKTAACLAAVFPSLAYRPHALLYLAGRDRKPDIEASLDALGQALTLVEVYEARPMPVLAPHAVTAIQTGRVEGVLHFSSRSATLFLDLAQAAGTDVNRLAHFCLSKDVADPLRHAACATVKIAEAPNEAALLTLVGSGG